MQNIYLITGLSIEEAIAGFYDNMLQTRDEALIANLIARNIPIRQQWVQLVEIMKQ